MTDSPPVRPALRIVDLRELKARDLDPLLREETVEWGLALDWDFSRSAHLVRRLADAPGLSGAALIDGSEIAAYGYVSLEEHTAWIWDVYVRPAWRNGNAEALLFRVLRDALIGTSRVSRIECQLMLLQKPLQREGAVRLFERLLLTRAADPPLPPGRASAGMKFRFEPWCDDQAERAATVLLHAYAGHIDSQINDRYRTLDRLLRFLRGLVRFPGSSTFCGPASRIAFDSATGEAAGISLAGFVADDVGHITELCVMPRAQGLGLGHELLRQSAAALHHAGAKRISLTVSAANEEAVRLYLRCGFRELRRFHACVWEIFPEKFPIPSDKPVSPRQI